MRRWIRSRPAPRSVTDAWPLATCRFGALHRWIAPASVTDESGHLAARYSADKVKCPLCEGDGRPAEHGMGRAECYPLLKGKKKTVPRKRLNVKSGGKAGDPGEPLEGAVSQPLPPGPDAVCAGPARLEKKGGRRGGKRGGLLAPLADPP